MRTRSSKNAFSLVETAIAIGLVAFAVSGLLGVFPVSLTELGRARNEVVVAELGNAALAKASQMDFSRLGDLTNAPVSLYDISGSGTTLSGKASYEVQTQVQTSSAHSRTVVVSVYRQPRSTPDVALAKYLLVVADNGR
jgi:uncharacterized protein (TIGR02598 family)